MTSLIENAQKGLMDAKQFWRTLGARATGMTIVTTQGPAGFIGLSAAHVTAQPPTLLVSVDRNTSALSPIIANRTFAFNYLAADQEPVAEAFSRRGASMEERFAPGRWGSIETGAPILVDALAAFDCLVEDIIERETAVILIGRVVGWAVGAERSPLVLFNGKYIR
jgi:flavin reductase (DIM6/NTAB) family NADH-FMN oxidoreductase RutF